MDNATPLLDILLADNEVSSQISAEELWKLCDQVKYMGCACNVQGISIGGTKLQNEYERWEAPHRSATSTLNN
jgi:hypothetical protein